MCVSKSLIVAISGYSGVGKSTMAQLLLCNLQDAVLLNGDIPFIQSPLYHKDEFENIFSRKLNTSDYVNCLRQAMNSNADALRRYVEATYPFINGELRTTVDSHANKSFIIIDSFILPMMDAWTDANYRIMVDAPKVERNKRLWERERDDDISKYYDVDCGELREKAFSELMRTAKNIDYLIYNTYDAHYEKECLYVCEKIKLGKQLQLPL